MTRSATATRFDQPFGEMNTTPLIDVMLVLLVMFIMAVPAAVNQISVDLPAPGPVSDHPVYRDRNRITIDGSSRVSWNDHLVTADQLAALLQETRGINPEPELRFEPDPTAPYDATAKVLNIIKRSGVSAFGFVGNDRYAAFAKAGAVR